MENADLIARMALSIVADDIVDDIPGDYEYEDDRPMPARKAAKLESEIQADVVEKTYAAALAAAVAVLQGGHSPNQEWEARSAAVSAA
jgi:hypothetical protein